MGSAKTSCKRHSLKLSRGEQVRELDFPPQEAGEEGRGFFPKAWPDSQACFVIHDLPGTRVTGARPLPGARAVHCSTSLATHWQTANERALYVACSQTQHCPALFSRTTALGSVDLL